jgi:hypothetical protein
MRLPVSATTDGFGYYVFSGLRNGTYAVTPSADGLAFFPARRDITVSGADVVAQDFKVGSWRWQNPLLQGNSLNGAWGSGQADVWAVGDCGTLLHWNGSAWHAVPSGTTAHLHAVWGIGVNDAWAPWAAAASPCTGMAAPGPKPSPFAPRAPEVIPEPSTLQPLCCVALSPQSAPERGPVYRWGRTALTLERENPAPATLFLGTTRT